MKTFGGSKPAQQQQQQQPPAQSWVARPQAPAPAPQQQAPAAPLAMPAMNRGLPPANPAIDTSNRGGGNFAPRRKTDADWDEYPLSPGDHEFNVVVADITWWAGGPTITFRVQQWDQDGGHPINHTRRDGVIDTHHNRPIKWENFFALDPSMNEKAYAFFRRGLVEAYASCGWPESAWPKDAAGNAAPPWHLFFVHRAPDDTAVPIVLRLKVRAYDDKNGRRRVAVDSLSPLPGPVQAPLPYRVPPVVADFHRWKVAKRDTFTVPARGNMPSYNVEYVAPDNDSIPLGHLGMAHYKDL